FYVVIAVCLERWHGYLGNDGFAFRGATNADRVGEARNRYNFEGYLSDSMTAILMLFFLQQCREANAAHISWHDHPPAATRLAALLSSRVGALLTGSTSPLLDMFETYGRRLATDLDAQDTVVSSTHVASALDEYRTVLTFLRPTARHDH